MVLIMLGTNDGVNWNEEQYKQDFIQMVTTFRELPTRPVIYIIIPPPLLKIVYIDGDFGFEMDHESKVVNQVLPQLIPQLAESVDIGEDQIISLFDLFARIPSRWCDYICDGIHPTDDGY